MAIFLDWGLSTKLMRQRLAFVGDRAISAAYGVFQLLWAVHHRFGNHTRVTLHEFYD